VLFEPDDPAPREKVRDGIPPSPSTVESLAWQIRSVAKHIVEPRSGPSYRDLYFACYSKTSKPVDEAERSPERQKAHGVEDRDTGAIVVHRLELRQQLFTAHEELREALRLVKAARGRCNLVARGLTDRS